MRGLLGHGESSNPSVPHDVVTALMKHDGAAHWQLKSGNAEQGPLTVCRR
jgi:hypothetical protein